MLANTKNNKKPHGDDDDQVPLRCNAMINALGSLKLSQICNKSEESELGAISSKHKYVK